MLDVTDNEVFTYDDPNEPNYEDEADDQEKDGDDLFIIHLVGYRITRVRLWAPRPLR